MSIQNHNFSFRLRHRQRSVVSVRRYRSELLSPVLQVQYAERYVDFSHSSKLSFTTKLQGLVKNSITLLVRHIF